jgi:hypothetical protein
MKRLVRIGAAGGRSDFNIFRTGVWYTQLASAGTTGVNWGIAGDQPAGRRPGS